MYICVSFIFSFSAEIKERNCICSLYIELGKKQNRVTVTGVSLCELVVFFLFIMLSNILQMLGNSVKQLAD